ncbi:hypothetical protein [Providencia sp. Je.9.19]|uniref:hypothetical protein n=1 Tax=unclassified Providencia TaxID=2633465 RepID=UPI003DA7E350
MKRMLLANLFMVVALLTSTSVFAQVTDSAISYDLAPYSTTQLKYISEQASVHEHEVGDLESEREVIEVSRLRLSENINDKRFTGRQFRIYD